MSDATLPSSDRDAAIFAIWRTFTWRLVAIALISIALAWPLSQLHRLPNGAGDSFYVALAWQFGIWGLIDLLFAMNGLVGLRRTAQLEPAFREAATVAQGTKILAALRFNRWLNAIWIASAIALLGWGYSVWSASLVGHGVGVFAQAVALVLYDQAFARALKGELKQAR